MSELHWYSHPGPPVERLPVHQSAVVDSSGMSGPHHKALCKLLKQNCNRYMLYDVFRDFVEMAAIAISNPIDVFRAPTREARYLQIMSKYEKREQERFPLMFGEVVHAMEAGPGDVLGAVFGELELANAATGQFFTPYSICQLMAQMTVGEGEDMRRLIARRGFVTASEPACGAGAQILALAEAMQSKGINYQQHLHVTAVDVDSRAVHMAYLQFSLAHIPAVIVHGNTLTLEERDHWLTPAHILGLWDAKLRRGYALGSELDSDSDVTKPAIAMTPAPAVVSVAEPSAVAPQLDLFGTVAA